MGTRLARWTGVFLAMLVLGACGSAEPEPAEDTADPVTQQATPTEDISAEDEAAEEARRERAAARRARERRERRAEERRARARAAARRERREQRRAEAAAQEQAEPEPTPEPVSDCDPNYEGACLDLNSSDYDCEGGSGDGPDYTGRVEVVGDDPHDLDRDGDGTACEA